MVINHLGNKLSQKILLILALSLEKEAEQCQNLNWLMMVLSQAKGIVFANLEEGATPCFVQMAIGLRRDILVGKGNFLTGNRERTCPGLGW